MRHTHHRSAIIHVDYPRDAFVAVVEQTWSHVARHAEAAAYFLLLVLLWGVILFEVWHTGF